MHLYLSITSLHLGILSAFGIRARYAKLYIPSDFMECQYTWNDAFALHRPLPTNEPSHFHVMAKGVPPVVVKEEIAPLNKRLHCRSALALYRSSIRLMLIIHSPRK